MMNELNQNRKNELSSYGEAVRLSNELRAVLAHDFTDMDGITTSIPEKWGFNCETAPIEDFTKWLSDDTIKKSDSLTMFVLRVMSQRFPNEKANIKSKLNKLDKDEFDSIIINKKPDVEWLGDVGYFDKIRLNAKPRKPKKFIKLNEAMS